MGIDRGFTGRLLRLRHLICVLVVMAAVIAGGCGSSGAPCAGLDSIHLTPDTATLPVGETQVFTAEGRNEAGNPVDFEPQWSVEGDIGTIQPAMATASTTSQYVFTATTAGAGNVCCDSGDIHAEAAVTVTGDVEPELTEIRMQPDAIACTIGETREILASGFDQNGDPIDFDPTWEVIGDIGRVEVYAATAAVNSTCVFYAESAGSGALRASCSGVVGEIPVTVTAP
ncbi:MAG: Ig-like domain-containing protein [Armatimonadota bacterium]